MRKAVALLLCLGLLFWLLRACHSMAPVGSFSGSYGMHLVDTAVAERHATNVVSAVNFDYRCLDTLGEEFILFSAVTSLTLLLRRQRDEEPDDRENAPARKERPTSEAVRLLGLFLLPTVMVFGITMGLHGAVTPGGGFQGGAILASALLQVYLVSDFTTMKKVFPHTWVEMTESLGAGCFVLLGLPGLIEGTAFFENVLPLGKPGEMLSGGMIFLVSVAILLAISGGFGLMLNEFLEQPLERGPS